MGCKYYLDGKVSELYTDLYGYLDNADPDKRSVERIYKILKKHGIATRIGGNIYLNQSNLPYSKRELTRIEGKYPGLLRTKFIKNTPESYYSRASELHTLSINDNILKNEIPADFESNADFNYDNEYQLESYLNTVATPQDRADLKLSEQIRRENTSEQRGPIEPTFPSLHHKTNRLVLADESEVRARTFQDMFAKHGITVDVVIDNTIWGLGQVDPTAPGENPTIRISPMASQDTVPHEFAHIYIDLLGLDNPAVKEALEELKKLDGRYMLLNDHMREYYPDYEGDMYDKELLATAMGLEYIRMENKAEYEAKNKNIPQAELNEVGWFENIIKAIKNFFRDILATSHLGELPGLNTKIEALTRDIFTGNLRVNEFTGKFNPALQQSRDQIKIKKIVDEQKVRVQGQINLVNKMPLEKREEELPRLEKLQASLKNIKKVEDFFNFVDGLGHSLSSAKFKYDRIMKIPINQRATHDNLNTIWKLKGELDGINAIKHIKNILRVKKSKFANISNPRNLKGEAFAQLHGFSDWKHVLNSLNKREGKLKHTEITKERFDALSNEDIKLIAAGSQSARKQSKSTTIRFDKLEDRVIEILDQFEEVDADFTENVIPILAEKLLPLHNKNIDKGIDDLIQNFEEGKKKGIYRYTGIQNSPELSDLKEQRALEEITQKEFEEARTNLAIEQLKNRKIMGRGDLIREMKNAHRDKSGYSYLFDPIIYSSEPVIQLFAKSVSAQNIEANDATLYFKGDLAYEYNEFTKGVNDFDVAKLNEDFIEEITVEIYNHKLKKNERKTVLAFINPIDQNKFYTEQLNFERELAEQYQKPERADYADEELFLEARTAWFKTSNGRNFLKKSKKWVTENTEPIEGWKAERDAVRNRIKESQKLKKDNKDNPAIVEEQENKIKRLRQFLNHNMIGIQNPIPRNDWVQPKKSKYANSKYTKIQSDPRLKRYYDFLIKSMNEGHDIIGAKNMYKNKWDKYSYILPSIRKEVLDRGIEQGYLKAGKDLIKDTFTITETNDDVGIYNDLSGDLVKQVPVYYTNLVDAKDVSKDIASSVYRFMNMAYKYKAKSKIVGEVMLFRHVMEQRGTLEVSSSGMEQVNKVAEQLGIKLPVLKKGDSYTFKHINEWIDTVMFGQTELKQEFNLFGKNLSATQIAGAVNKFTALNNLSFNLLQATNQYIMDNMSLLQEGIAGEFMTKKDLAWAKSKAYSEGMGMKDIGEFMPNTKLGKAMEFFDALVEVTDREGNRLVGNKARKALDSGNLMVLQQAVEYQLSATRMLALMKNLEGKLKDKNGNVIKRNGKNANLYDLLLIDEKGRMSLDPELSEDSFSRNDFIHLLRGLGRRTNQVKGKFDHGMINRTWYGKMINLFRSWVAPGIRRRYGHGGFTGSTIHTDEELGTVTQGYYISFANLVTESLSRNKLNVVKTYGEMTEMEQHNIKRALTELSALIATAVLIGTLSNLDDDEETWVSNFVLYQATRYQMEILQWTPVVGTKEALRILKSPTATARPIEDGIEILDQILFQEFPYLFGIGDEKDIFYQRRTGRYDAGDRKIGKQFYDMIPILRGLNRSKTPEEAQKWFNSMK